jgi:hypothetical protein
MERKEEMIFLITFDEWHAIYNNIDAKIIKCKSV